MGRSPTNSRGIAQTSAEIPTTFVTTFTDELILSRAGSSTMLVNAPYSATRTRTRAKGAIMKLQLISSAVVVYTALAVACICYAGV
jgi:hypothetical protein